MQGHLNEEILLEGIAGSPGVAHGTAYLFLHREIEAPAYKVPKEKMGAEIQRFELAIFKTRHQITMLRNQIADKLGEDEARIFDAHQLVLEDKALLDETIRKLEETGFNIDYCFNAVAKRYIEAFANIDDEFIRERITDIRDVTRRLLGNLLGNLIQSLANLKEKTILISKDLTPSDTVTLNKEQVIGIANDVGGHTSHAVLMARSIEVPAVVGLHNITEKINTGDVVIIDGYDGIVIIHPSQDTLFRYGKVELKRQEQKKRFRSTTKLPTETKDGKKLVVKANIKDIEDTIKAKASGAQGIGLFRTEGIYLREGIFLPEEEQFNAYRKVVQSINPDSVIFRTLDLGGDKGFGEKHMQHIENNPFMGFRAIRFCLKYPELFKTQLRAILRASHFGNIGVMYPMISSPQELIQANHLLEASKQELRACSENFDENIRVGVMIEIPSAALSADLLAENCDFFSIGTNDLIQYMFAVDRINEYVAHLYMPNQPAVIRVIKDVIDVGRRKGIPVSICGEMAADPLYVPLLFGMGADALSVTPGVLPEVKYIIRHMKITEAERLAEDVLNCTQPKEILTLLKNFYLVQMES
jgi:phosphoenolpyruvate-protein phosphotransferase (PTS system enzyme I)